MGGCALHPGVFSVPGKFQEEWGSNQECWKLREIFGGHWAPRKKVGACMAGEWIRLLLHFRKGKY